MLFLNYCIRVLFDVHTFISLMSKIIQETNPQIRLKKIVSLLGKSFLLTFIAFQYIISSSYLRIQKEMDYLYLLISNK